MISRPLRSSPQRAWRKPYPTTPLQCAFGIAPGTERKKDGVPDFPIPLVEFQSCRGLDFFRDLSGEESTSILYTWLIQGEKTPVLVDPCVNAEDISRYSSGGFSGKRISSFGEGLSRFGLKATDIEVVILTHLHYDHFVNAKECKNARVIVQKRELDFAFNPHPLLPALTVKNGTKGSISKRSRGSRDCSRDPGPPDAWPYGREPVCGDSNRERESRHCGFLFYL